LKNGAAEKRFTIIVKSRILPVGDNAKIHPLFVHADQTAIAAGKKMKLDPVVHLARCREVRLKCDVPVLPADVSYQFRGSRHHGVPTVGADNAFYCNASIRVGANFAAGSDSMHSILFKHRHTGILGMLQQGRVKQAAADGDQASPVCLARNMQKATIRGRECGTLDLMLRERAYFLGHSQPLQHGPAVWIDHVAAHFVTREPGVFEESHAQPALGAKRGSGRTGWPPANHDYVELTHADGPRGWH
jgi:hypothetical protein